MDKQAFMNKATANVQTYKRGDDLKEAFKQALVVEGVASLAMEVKNYMVVRKGGAPIQMALRSPQMLIGSLVFSVVVSYASIKLSKYLEDKLQ